MAKTVVSGRFSRITNLGDLPPQIKLSFYLSPTWLSIQDLQNVV